jgi:MFS family permease
LGKAAFSFTVREKEGIKSMQQQPIDYSRKWYVMAAVAMGIFLAAIDGSIVNIALPTLVRELRTDFAIVQWVVLAYLMTVTTLTLSVGRLADMVGKKTLYTSGFVVFTIGSLLCGLAPTVYWLIGFRVLQAIGAAMTMALGTGMCQDPLDRFVSPILVHSLRPLRRTPPAQTSRPRPRRQGAAAAAETLDAAAAAGWRAGVAGVAATRLGWGRFIPTAVGTNGGVGRPPTNRSEWAA